MYLLNFLRYNSNFLFTIHKLKKLPIFEQNIVLLFCDNTSNQNVVDCNS